MYIKSLNIDVSLEYTSLHSLISVKSVISVTDADFSNVLPYDQWYSTCLDLNLTNRYDTINIKLCRKTVSKINLLHGVQALHITV